MRLTYLRNSHNYKISKTRPSWIEWTKSTKAFKRHSGNTIINSMILTTLPINKKTLITSKDRSKIPLLKANSYKNSKSNSSSCKKSSKSKSTPVLKSCKNSTKSTNSSKNSKNNPSSNCSTRSSKSNVKINFSTFKKTTKILMKKLTLSNSSFKTWE